MSDYDYDGEFWEGSSGGIDDSDSDGNLDVDFNVEDVEEASKEEECNESLVDSGENGSNDGSDQYDCIMSDISGIPCKHGMRCILRERQDIDSYVHEAYIIKAYL